MASTDKMTVEILPDGTVKTTIDPISPANHNSAEGFVSLLAKLTGGKTTINKKARATAGAGVHHHEEA